MISEAIQLENMIFSSKPAQKEENGILSNEAESSDWALRFCEMDASDDENCKLKKGEERKTFFDELNAFIIETRKSQMEEAAMSISRLNLIKK